MRLDQKRPEHVTGSTLFLELTDSIIHRGKGGFGLSVSGSETMSLQLFSSSLHSAGVLILWVSLNNMILRNRNFL